MSDTVQENLTEDEKLAREYYKKLDGYVQQAALRSSIGYPLTAKSTKQLIHQYLVFRGWGLRKNESLERMALLLLEQSAKDEKVVIGLSLPYATRKSQ